VERSLGVDYDTAWARRYGTRLARALVLDAVGRPLVQAMASPTVDGLDRIAALPAPAVFAANHASHVDTPLLLTVLPDRFRHRAVVAAGADYFFDKRWKAHMWAFAINAIPVERTRVSTKSIRLASRLLGDGWSLVIFPEGGRSQDGWGQTHHPGAAHLAARAGVPVVPIHVEGTRRILKRGARAIRPATTHVTFGRPLRADDDEDARRFAGRIESAVAVLADEQASGFWVARRRAADGLTPALTGPPAAAWRRAWALEEGRRPASDEPRAGRWPDV